MTKRTSAGQPSLRERGMKTLCSVSRRWQLLVMILPALIYLILFAYKPMYGIVIAFKNYSLKRGIAGSAWCGLDNFRRLFRSYWFPIILKNTLSLSLLSLVLGFPMPIILALMVNEMRSEPLKRLFQTVSYAPHFISTVVVCGMVILFTNPSSGIINVGLKAIGIEPVAFMQRPDLFKWVYVLSGIWQGMGWGAIIYFAALSGVDRSLLEAAEIDGANRLQRIIYINFPVLVPTMITLFILQCGQVLNVGYEKVYALQNPTNLTGSEVISTYVYKVGLVDKDFSFSTAAGLFNSVVNCVVLVLVNWISRRTTNTSLICSDLMQRKGTTCIQKPRARKTCNCGSTRAPLMKRMLCREMIFAL